MAAFSILSPVIEMDFPPPPRSLFQTLATRIGGETLSFFMPSSTLLWILIKVDSRVSSSFFVSLFTNIIHGF